jgi:hypothetical protein
MANCALLRCRLRMFMFGICLNPAGLTVLCA